VSHAPARRLSAAEVSLPERHPLRKAGLVAAAAGALAVAAVLALAAGDPRQALASYLVAFLYWLSIALGGLFFNLAMLASRAGWCVVVRRLAEHLAGTLWLYALLFVPLAVGAAYVWPWWGGADPAADPILAGKAGWLDPGFFWLRSAVYLAAWALLGWWFRRRSLAQDASGDPGVTRRLQALAAPAILVYALTQTFAAFDWIMSLDPHWYSTIFGVYFFAGQAVAIFSLLALLAMALERGGKAEGGERRPGPLAGVVTVEHYHDLGKLLFAFVVFWAYIAFSQFMLIWYANIPEETVWYAHRLEHGWEGATWALAIGHFVLPFFFLLPRGVKRKRSTLAAAAVWMLVVHYLDLYWLAMPAIHPEGFRPHLLDLVALLGIGGLALGALAFALARPALVPIGDPRLPESLSFENM